MGCGNSKKPASAPAAAPGLMKPEAANDGKKLGDYAKLVASSNPDEVKAAVAGLSDHSRDALLEVIDSLAAPPKTLADYFASVSAASDADLITAMSSLSPESRKILEDVLNVTDTKTQDELNKNDTTDTKTQDEPNKNDIVDDSAEKADDEEQQIVQDYEAPGFKVESTGANDSKGSWSCCS
eukprot:CAMPEP_0169219434 /NCGR_PEP_ID=MMETSP1016-20121227/19974_1 /TAXON_ID=342587 /ORGANISM="Karlodinium micrum, Strain CCMP2283" /LENGTH=181 /DNA_ID=CAMNT_0009297497 /DNA_START=48 /DNA_END=593 /DNA_ORIENTATION=-